MRELVKLIKGCKEKIIIWQLIGTKRKKNVMV